MSVDAYTQHRLQCIIFQLDLSKKFKLPLILVITLYHKSVSFVYWMVHSYCDSLQQIPWACYSLDNVLCSGQCAVLGACYKPGQCACSESEHTHIYTSVHTIMDPTRRCSASTSCST